MDNSTFNRIWIKLNSIDCMKQIINKIYFNGMILQEKC